MSPESARQVQLRRDLEQSHQLQQGKSYLVVKDPVTRRYFRFTEAQAAIIALMMDEPRDVESVAALASGKLNAAVSPATIEAFCKSLDEKFLLETPEVREKLGTIKGQQLEGRNFLYWKIASVDPERIFAWLLPRTRFVYTLPFQIFMMMTIATGFTLMFLNWNQLSGAAPGLLSIYGFLLIFPVMFSVTTIHEFSHGLTCCHYGGKVHEVGFMLIYFNPAFYCDVSDSYMFPKRTHRMAVGLAGGYAQLTLWGICAVIWRITDGAAFIHQVALIVVVFSGLQTLFNFNPLIKLDGYYMLSDFLEVPNLRAKALQTFWDWLAGNGKARWTHREKRAQLVYGLASMAFSTTLLWYVYSALYTWATTTYALAGLVVFGIFANFTLRKALIEPMESVKALAGRPSIKRYRTLAIIFVLLILSFFVRWELKIPAHFKIVAQEELVVRAGTDGVLTEILVQEGDRVHKGQVVARQVDFDKQDKLRDTYGYLQEQKHALEDLRKGTRPELIEEQERTIARQRVELGNVYKYEEQRKQLQENLAGENAKLDLARKNLQRDQSGFDRGVTPRVTVDADQSAVSVAERSVSSIEAGIRSLKENADREADRLTHAIAEAESHLKTLRAGNRPDQILQTEAEVNRLQSLVDLLSAEYKKTDIVADIDGVEVTPYVGRMVGTRLYRGDEVMRIVNAATVTAEMMVSEKEMADVHKDQDVWMRVDGFPTRDFKGTVSFIAPVAQSADGQQTVRVVLRNDDGVLKRDMNGFAKIYCGKRRIIDIMTRRIRRWINTEFWDLLP